jgi:hypothetical protein
MPFQEGIMFRIAAIFALLAAPAAAGTCTETEAMMRSEGVRALMRAGCIESPGEVPAEWNAVFDTPAGACMASRFITGDPAILGLTAYMEMKNTQRRAAGCPLKG